MNCTLVRDAPQVFAELELGDRRSYIEVFKGVLPFLELHTLAP